MSEVECGLCQDTRKCPVCNGTGKAERVGGSERVPIYSDCPSCGGTGVCKWCKKHETAISY